MKSGFSEINGIKFYYETDGSGELLVLVHAGIADCRMWDDQFHVLAQKNQVMRYDRRGFGKTGMVGGNYSHHQDLYDLLKPMSIQHAILVGSSQGAKTIIDFTLEHPDYTKAIVLVSPALGGFIFTGNPPIQAKQLEQADKKGDMELVNELELQIWVDGPRRTPDQVDTKVRELVRDMNRIALQTPLDFGNELSLEPTAVNRISKIHVPTLIIAGDMDTPKTLACADFLATHIPGAKKVTMHGVAHLLNMEHPQAFNQHVVSFLDRL